MSQGHFRRISQHSSRPVAGQFLLQARFRPGRLALLLAVSAVVVVSAGANGGTELQYAWRSGEQYAYSFSISVQGNGESAEWKGGCVYTASKAPPAPRKDAGTGPITGNGTGFVVSAQGHIATCAHVVKGAIKIDAVINGKTYKAKVVAFDRPHDLAVVQVEATDLPVIALTDSDKVELNQDVLAVGFPMASVVGENIKVSRGVIAGVIDSKDNKEDKIFQVDAAINPGNSGGPVVNDSGQVIGVASAKLVGNDVSNIGFVVPSNDVARLLKNNGIQYVVRDGGEALKSTELAKLAKPSVALLNVTIDPQALEAERRQINYRGYCQTITKTTMQTQTDQGRFIANVQGEISENSGLKLVPWGAGELGELLIEQLANDGKKKWQVGRLSKVTQVIETPVTVVQQQPAQPAPGMRPSPRSRMRPHVPGAPPAQGGGGGGNYGFGGLRTRAQTFTAKSVVTHLAVERTTYEVVDTSDGIMTIKKRYEFTTQPKAGEKPYMTIEGTGMIEFDLNAGAPRGMMLDLIVEINERGKSEKGPIKVRCERVNPSELKFPNGSTAVVNISPSNSATQSTSATGGNSSSTGGAATSASSGVSGSKPAALGKSATKKVPAPDDAAIAKAQALVIELFKKDLDASKTAAKKHELAKQLIDHARAEKSDASARYALLDKARQLAVEAGVAEVAFDAADDLAAGYEIDGMQVKVDTLASLASSDAPTEKQRILAKKALAIFDEGVDADRYDIAKRAGGLALAAAGKSRDGKLTERIKQRGQQYKALQEAYSTVRTAQTTLKTSPDDANANLVVGRFRCLFKGDWTGGLTQLVKGSDAKLKTLAQQELAVQANPEELLAVADGWYDLADQYAAPAKEKLFEHASQFYEKAVPNLSGLSKVKAEKRVIKSDADDVADGSDEGGAKATGGTTTRQSLLQRVRAQVKDQHIARTREAGVFTGKNEFSAVPDTGGLLLGFDLTTNGTRILSLRPIFFTDKGQVPGPMFGVPGKASIKVIAKSGYAVGGIRIKAGLQIDGMSVTFMEVGPKGLNAAKSYQSDWVGGTGGAEFQLGGDGSPVVGIFGHGTTTKPTSLGLVLGTTN